MTFAKGTGITVSVHDLRRTFIMLAESTDISPLALKALVNHALGNDDQRYVQMTVERLRGPAHQHLSGEPLVTLRCAFVQFPPHFGQLALELHNLLLRIGADALLRVGLMRSP